MIWTLLFLSAGSLSMSHAVPPDAAELRARLATVNVAPERFDRWLNQFPPDLRGDALTFLNELELFDYARFNRSLKSLHERLVKQVTCDGFLLDQLDFTKPYTARSGDLVAFFYRRANLIPSARISPSELLKERRADVADRALVILDDYVGSFAQILGEYFGKMFADSFNRYRKIYVTTIAAHPAGRENLARLKRGEGDLVVRDLVRLFAIDDAGAKRFADGLAKVEPAKVELVFVHEDRPFRADRHARLFAYLRENVRFERSTQAPLGVAGLASALTFFYGPPNGAPDALWNPRGASAAGTFVPLFPRVEDISHYDFAAGLPEDQVIWGER
jgi:hypothetical protein